MHDHAGMQASTHTNTQINEHGTNNKGDKISHIAQITSVISHLTKPTGQLSIKIYNMNHIALKWLI